MGRGTWWGVAGRGETTMTEVVPSGGGEVTATDGP